MSNHISPDEIDQALCGFWLERIRSGEITAPEQREAVNYLKVVNYDPTDGVVGAMLAQKRLDEEEKIANLPTQSDT